MIMLVPSSEYKQRASSFSPRLTHCHKHPVLVRP
jgi:hypothetical protein